VCREIDELHIKLDESGKKHKNENLKLIEKCDIQIQEKEILIKKVGEIKSENERSMKDQLIKKKKMVIQNAEFVHKINNLESEKANFESRYKEKINEISINSTKINELNQ